MTDALELWCVVDSGVAVAMYHTESQARLWDAQPGRTIVRLVTDGRMRAALEMKRNETIAACASKCPARARPTTARSTGRSNASGRSGRC